ncbi:OmpA family protein [Luteibaculum oceani]|uniref:OmpA family protein n=1 Tax=Luteibaculum oceani TaxID=1294296 RepID=A0A5C6VLH3_9FLAO|nr:OmpA family protein [Luteibaculum oceani]TXC85276.1 OmpA family protein [Luteibaculum oceani]
MIRQAFQLLLLTVISGLAVNTSAQSFRSSLELADLAYNQGNYYTAAQYYHEVFQELKEPEKTAFPYGGATPKKKNEEFNTYKYVIGQLARSYYFYKDYPKAEAWYAKTVSLDEYSDIENLINYGICLRANENFDEAVIMLNKAKQQYRPKYIENDGGKLVESESTKGMYKRIEFELACAKFAQEQLKVNSAFVPEKLDTLVLNVEDASNYAASLMPNDKMAFTTTRTIVDNPSSKKYGAYRNSIMTYNLIDSSLTPLEFGFGLDRNAAAPAVNGDATAMYFTSWSNDEENPQLKIYMSRPLNDSIWEEPKPLNSIVNLPGTNAKQPSVTKDGRMLYFASDRKEGFGGFDIYYVRLDEMGQPFGRALNAGDNVNTERDEETPFFDEVGQILYFSSKGWIGMGGLDVFMAEKRSNGFGKAQNMGYPLNSSKDDAYFITASDVNIGYVSSDRGRNTCCYQLYSFEMAYYFVGGTVLDAVDDTYLQNVKVTLIDSNGLEVAIAYTDDLGKYTLPVTKGRNYKVIYNKDNFLEDEMFISTALIYPNDTTDLGVVKLITTEVGRAVKLENIYYDFGKATLRESSKEVLAKLARQLKKYPYLVIEIGSHTDNIGSDKYNFDLSNRRSQSVVDFLISQGINKSMIVARGYGESMPKVPNTNPDGSDNEANRQINRRTEFKVLEYRFENEK